MSRFKILCTSLVFYVEIGALVAAVLYPVFWQNNDHAVVIHDNAMSLYLTLVLSVGFSGMSCVMRMLMTKRGIVWLGKWFWGIILLDAIVIFLAIITTVFKYPDTFRLGEALIASQRMSSINAVRVDFDSNGGVCSDSVRVVPVGGTYQENINLYPSEDERYFSDLRGVGIDLEHNLFCIDLVNTSREIKFANYFSKNVIGCVKANEPWTYVIDIIESNGRMGNWAVGQTVAVYKELATCFDFSEIGVVAKARGVVIKTLNGSSHAEGGGLLDRAYIGVLPGQHLRMKFRISLYAGMGVNTNNYHYVVPGSSIKGALPQPKRLGYRFKGWYDRDVKISETSKVVSQASHTLKARWEKLPE